MQNIILFLTILAEWKTIIRLTYKKRKKKKKQYHHFGEHNLSNVIRQLRCWNVDWRFHELELEIKDEKSPTAGDVWKG